MSLKRGRVRAVLAGTVLAVIVGGGACAQEISQSHLQAALEATHVAPGVGDFNNLLPFLSEKVQNRPIRTRPDLFREIQTAVEGQALELSVRRSELENDVARIWARRFTEDELKTISGFFGSELGAKYKEIVPAVGEEILRASSAWADRVSEELYERSLSALKRDGHEF